MKNLRIDFMYSKIVLVKGDSFTMCIINMTIAYNNGKMESWKILKFLNLCLYFRFIEFLVNKRNNSIKLMN